MIINFYNGFIGTNESYVSLSGSVGNSFILRNLTYGGDTLMNFQAASGGYYHYIGALINGLDNEGAALQFSFLNTSGGAL